MINYRFFTLCKAIYQYNNDLKVVLGNDFRLCAYRLHDDKTYSNGTLRRIFKIVSENEIFYIFIKNLFCIYPLSNRLHHSGIKILFSISDGL